MPGMQKNNSTKADHVLYHVTKPGAWGAGQ
jgi:hypothetical protein